MSLQKVNYTQIRGGVPNVFDFGAVGDGVTDDTAAFVAALSLGGLITIPPATYKITTVSITGVNNLNIYAVGAIINSTQQQAFNFVDCNNFSWQGGQIFTGTVTSTTSFPWCFVVKGTTGVNNVLIDGLSVTRNTSAAHVPCISVWQGNEATITNCKTTNGGDNSIYVMHSTQVVVSNNTVVANQAGRSICLQQCNVANIVGNNVSNGYGDGISIHGTSNVSVTGNSVYNMAVDTVELQTARGIAVEWDENATPTTVAAAYANPQLINNVFCRNVTISGNTIGYISQGMTIGNNIGVSGANYGNFGVVDIIGNTFFSVASGIDCGTSSQVRISNNFISTTNTFCVQVPMQADTGGYIANNIYITGNRFSNFNNSNTGYFVVEFINSGTFNSQRLFVITDNEWDTPNYGDGFCNLALSVYGINSSNNRYAPGTANTVLTNQTSPFEYQPPFSDQTGANYLSSNFAVGNSYEFTQSGQVLDSFVTVFTMPTNSTVFAQIQIGSNDRLVCFGTIYASNGSTPSLTFTGTGSSYVQLSGSNIQIKGNTSGGTVTYGGIYSIKYTVLKPI